MNLATPDERINATIMEAAASVDVDGFFGALARASPAP
jgi:hypothetical protein